MIISGAEEVVLIKSQIREILIFTLITMVIGLPLKKYFQSYGQTEMASQEPSIKVPYDIDNAFNSTPTLADTRYDISNSLTAISSINNLQKEKDKLSCPGCLLQKIEEASAFEKPEMCGKDRNYLNDLIAQIPDVLRKPRPLVRQDLIYQQCVTHVLRNSFKDAERKPNRKFAICTDPYGKPGRGRKKPCVTEDYATSIYNTFMDVGNCFDVDPKNLLPKVYLESGMHLNAYGSGMDAGIGQLTESGIQDVNKIDFDKEQDFVRDIAFGELSEVEVDSVNSSMEELKSFVTSAEKKNACGNILKANEDLRNLTYKVGKKTHNYRGVFEKVSKNLGERCGFMRPPENPLRNLLYTAWLNRKNKNYFEDSYQKRHNIYEKIANAGLKLNATQKETLKESIILLSYNAGAGSAAGYLSAYLDLRLAAIQKAEAINKKIREENKKIKQAKKQRKQISVPYLTNADFNYDASTTHAAEFRNDSFVSKAIRKSAEKAAEKEYAEALKKYEELLEKAKTPSKEPIEVTKVTSASPIPQITPADKESKDVVSKVESLPKPDRKKILQKHRAVAEEEIQKRQNDFLSKPIRFSEYLRVMQTSGSSLYLNMLSKMKKQLDLELGAGRCTKDQYINL